MAKPSSRKNANAKDLSSVPRIQFWREHILNQQQGDKVLCYLVYPNPFGFTVIQLILENKLMV